MLPRLLSCVFTFAILPAAACSTPSDVFPSGADAGSDGGTFAIPRDSGRRDTAPPSVDARTPWNRMQPHSHRVLAAMRLQVVYLGMEGDGGAPSFDEFIDWLLASDYWAIMEQYGVGHGQRVGSVRIAPSGVIPAGAVKNGLLLPEDLETFVYGAIHPASSTDGGLDADAADDGGSVPLIPIADAYLIFLPNNVNVDLGERGGHVFQTCVDTGGYHSHDGAEPYAVIPPCAFGRSALAVSHELAEMATDPLPGTGWFSDKDIDNAGGEIGDLCNQPVSRGVDGWLVTQLWSNADGDCEP